MGQVYINSTLHNDWNIKFNPELCKALESVGIICYLPQRDTNQQAPSQEKFTQNNGAIKRIDIMLAVANNESPNWGAELGYAYGLGKRIIALAATGHEIPLMAKHMVGEVMMVDNLDDISSYIDKLVKTLKINGHV